ncbi:hypothetical protein PRIPAC_78473 [Pristionchus pacificus]|uniref:Uncharacterized protein n=1 Tax=Pristionchus pacificus TaxID=54126 RepID=A0A454XNR5_PRIPA|nr:hypothetical protein PRIPAC_78473 [Pristionchus pacificus]|eukprot:PDM79826.1 hypothetical protein PRIPAC_32405 [Pristionchus pacificus]
MRGLTVLYCALTAIAACVPTKHPEPGIPAVKKCPKWPVVTSAECTTITCDLTMQPMISDTSMSCANGFLMIVDKNPATGMLEVDVIAYSASCKDGVWYDDDAGMLLTPTPPNPPVYVGCVP